MGERGSFAMQSELMMFSGRGRVWSWTIVSRSAAPERFYDNAPYAVALVRLEEGPLVTAMLTDVNFDEICFDMEVEAVTRFLYEDGEGGRGLRVYGYKFRPPMSYLIQ